MVEVGAKLQIPEMKGGLVLINMADLTNLTFIFKDYKTIEIFRYGLKSSSSLT